MVECKLTIKFILKSVAITYSYSIVLTHLVLVELTYKNGLDHNFTPCLFLHKYVINFARLFSYRIRITDF